MIGGPQCCAFYETEELTHEIHIRGYTKWEALPELAPEGIARLKPVEPHDRIHTYKRGCAYVGRKNKARILIMEYRHSKVEEL